MGCYICVSLIIGAVLAVFKTYIKLSTGWCRSNVCLVGKTVIVTGANTGIGYEAAEDFAKRGARVILACRNEEKGKDAEEKMKKASNNPNIVFKKLNVASMKSVREFADDIKKSEDRIDILLNNAGIGDSPKEKTEDGFLIINATNYYGPFLLTNLLLDLIVKTPNSRIVNVSSVCAKYLKWFGPLDTKNLNNVSEQFMSQLYPYSRTKVCLILFTIELAKRLRQTSTTTYSLHPGVIYTNIFSTLASFLRIFAAILMPFLGKTCLEGAQTSIYCSVQKGIELHSGEHFEDCRLQKKYESVQDPELPKKLWDETAYLVGLNRK